MKEWKSYGSLNNVLYIFFILYKIYFLLYNYYKIKAMNLTKLCSKFEVDITKNESWRVEYLFRSLRPFQQYIICHN